MRSCDTLGSVTREYYLYMPIDSAKHDIILRFDICNNEKLYLSGHVYLLLLHQCLPHILDIYEINTFQVKRQEIVDSERIYLYNFSHYDKLFNVFCLFFKIKFLKDNHELMF